MKTYATNKLTHVYLQKLRRETSVATVSTALIVIISLFWELFKIGGPEKTIYFADSMYAVAAWIGAFWACRIAYRAQRGPLRLEPRQRLAWLFVGIGLLCNGLGGAYYTYFDWIGGINPVPSLADLCFTLFYLFTFVGLLLMPTVAGFLLMPTIPKPKQSLIRSALDALIPTISILGISWYFVIGPIFATSRDLPTLLVAITYPFWDILLILALALLIRRHVERILFPSLLLFGVGILCQICADRN